MTPQRAFAAYLLLLLSIFVMNVGLFLALGALR